MTHRIKTADKHGATDFFVVIAQTVTQAQGDARRMHAERHGVGYAEVSVMQPDLQPRVMATAQAFDRALSWGIN